MQVSNTTAPNALTNTARTPATAERSAMMASSSGSPAGSRAQSPTPGARDRFVSSGTPTCEFAAGASVSAPAVGRSRSVVRSGDDVARVESSIAAIPTSTMVGILGSPIGTIDRARSTAGRRGPARPIEVQIGRSQLEYRNPTETVHLPDDIWSNPQLRHAAQQASTALINRCDLGGWWATGVKLRQASSVRVQEGIDVEFERLPAVATGAYATVAGRAVNRVPIAIGGEAPPPGTYLVLDRPLLVDGTATRELFVNSGASFADGQHLQLHGQLGQMSYGGVETPPSVLYTLSGVTNHGAGEPDFDGRGFRNAQGDELQQLTYVRPQITDVPATILVLDPRQSTAFIGERGGNLPPGINPFFGFSGRAAISTPSDADRAQVHFEANSETPVNAGGEPLVLIGDSGPASSYPDAMTSRWFYDARQRTAYEFTNGGIAGFHDRMSAVIRLPQA